MYFDSAATMKPIQQSLDEFMRVQQLVWANPSALHGPGQRAKAELEFSRSRVATVLGCRHDQIIFTPNATYADNAVLLGNSLNEGKKDQISSSIAHSALYEVKNSALHSQLANQIEIKVDGLRAVSWADIEPVTTENTALISLLHVNNEHGAITPISRIYGQIKELNKQRDQLIRFHIDGVQAPLLQDLKESITVSDYYVISGHKIGAPRGCAILYVKDVSTLASFMSGGGQEQGISPGTENLAAVVATVKALEVQQANLQQNRNHINTLFAEILKVSTSMNLKIINSTDEFQHSHVLIEIPNADAQEVITYADLKGCFLSAGSSCKSGSNTISHVIRNSSLDERSAYIRMSLEPASTLKDSLVCLDILDQFASSN